MNAVRTFIQQKKQYLKKQEKTLGIPDEGISLTEYPEVAIFLRELYTHISDAFVAYKQRIITMTNIQEKKITSVDRIPRASQSLYTFIHPEIRSHIEEHSSTVHTISMMIGQRKYNLHIILESIENSRARTKKVQTIVQYTFYWLHVLQKYAEMQNTGSYRGPQPCSTEVGIYFYMTSMKKSLPEHCNTPIGIHHVNTAVTTGCQASTNIHVFREEEWFKVLIHESFHNSGLDFIDMDPTTLKQMTDVIRILFPVSVPDLRIYETYAEMWAEILNNMFIVYDIFYSKNSKNKQTIRKYRKTIERNKRKNIIDGYEQDDEAHDSPDSRDLMREPVVIDNTMSRRRGSRAPRYQNRNQNQNQIHSRGFPVKNKREISQRQMDDMIHELDERLKSEAVFSAFQANKLLKHHHGMKYEELYIDRVKAKTYTEETQCFSYFILKGILMMHYRDFLIFCSVQNPGKKASIDFVLESKNLRKYVDLITHQYNHPKTLLYMNKMRNYLDKTKSQNTVKMTSMRMSLYDIFVK
jgi:hypothetical protein